MTDIHAALGLSQMRRLDEFVSMRHAIAKRYDGMLGGLPLVTPWHSHDRYSSYHLYIVRLNLHESKVTHRQLYDGMRARGILVNMHYIPVYRQPYYEEMGFGLGYCPEAERHFSEAISIPMYSGLTKSEQDHVVGHLSEMMCA
jgi:dTDP-4-amino-4,6-dideoxygalactose transaminase